MITNDGSIDDVALWATPTNTQRFPGKWGMESNEVEIENEEVIVMD